MSPRLHVSPNYGYSTGHDIRDLPTFGQAVYLRVPRRQFYCRHCQKYVTEKLDFISWRRRFTQRYESYIYQRVLQSNIEQVSREEDLTYDEVEGIFNFVSNQQKRRTTQTIREHLLGICNYFISGATSGVMAGINNKIKLIMRLGYGLTNFNNLRSRLLGCCC